MLLYSNNYIIFLETELVQISHSHKRPYVGTLDTVPMWICVIA